ncbi:NAD(P)-dependent dehydrogenase (short-subunit alcohol dehydrogenase family) [Paraburkholderia sp. GAS199]|uniref:SDR family NAD(P)-dependent oxidoreductase n=1 Tax=Paraburkholderia sp. GAS199 TaxID=3035126 RepID=UPI003D21CBFD
MSLVDRRIIVTGAASGIGRGAAAYLAALGARVALLDRDADGLARSVDAIPSSAPSAIADVTDDQAVDVAVQQLIDSLGGLDGVVNCAGVDLLRPFDETQSADWQRVLAVNLFGPVNVCKAALPALRHGNRPAIVNVASAAGLHPLPNRTAYCSSKAALVMFGKALAIDLAPDGIRVNSICPGIVETPMLDASILASPDPHNALSHITSRYLIPRAGKVDEIAAAIAFLLDDAAGYITGSSLAVDGGRSFH